MPAAAAAWVRSHPLTMACTASPATYRSRTGDVPPARVDYIGGGLWRLVLTLCSVPAGVVLFSGSGCAPRPECLGWGPMSNHAFGDPCARVGGGRWRRGVAAGAVLVALAAAGCSGSSGGSGASGRVSPGGASGSGGLVTPGLGAGPAVAGEVEGAGARSGSGGLVTPGPGTGPVARGGE